MAKKKPKEKDSIPANAQAAPRSARSGSRHKDRHMIPQRGDVYRQLQLLAERNSRPLTWQVRLLLIEALKAEGLWPPPKDAD